MSRLIIIGVLCANAIKLRDDDDLVDMSELALYSETIAGDDDSSGIEIVDPSEKPAPKKKPNLATIKTDIMESAETESSYELAADMSANGLATGEMGNLKGSLALGGEMSIQDQSAALAQLKDENKDAIAQAQTIEKERKKNANSAVLLAKKKAEEQKKEDEAEKMLDPELKIMLNSDKQSDDFLDGLLKEMKL